MAKDRYAGSAQVRAKVAKIILLPLALTDAGTVELRRRAIFCIFATSTGLLATISLFMEHSFSMVILIVIAIVVVSYIAFNKPDVVERLCFDAEKVRSRRQYYRLVSHVLVHGGWMHLIFNVMTLYFFGPLAERLFEIFFPGNGGLVFLVYFAGASVVSSLPSMRHRSYSAIGASGAIAAVMFTGILIRPQMEIRMFPLTMGIPAYLFGGLYLAFSYYMSRNSNDNIGHEAHFWGAVYGFVLPILYDARFLSEFISNIKG